MEPAATKKYLVHFIKKFKYLDFCLPEFESLVTLYCPGALGSWAVGKPFPCYRTLRERLYCRPYSNADIAKHPMAYVNLPSAEVADRIVKRSILIKEVIDVISEAKSYPELLENVDKVKLYPLLESGKSFKFSIEGIGRKISQKEQVEIMESFGIFPFQKNIDLKNPQIVFRVIEN